jgi:hypothetical protein
VAVGLAFLVGYKAPHAERLAQSGDTMRISPQMFRSVATNGSSTLEDTAVTKETQHQQEPAALGKEL